MRGLGALIGFTICQNGEKANERCECIAKNKKGGRQFLTSSFTARRLGPGGVWCGGAQGLSTGSGREKGKPHFFSLFFFFLTLFVFFVTFFIDWLLIPPSSDTSSPPVGSSVFLKLEKSPPSFVRPQTCRPPFCPWAVAFFVCPVGCFVGLPRCPLSPGDRRLSNCHSGCMSSSILVFFFFL